MKKTINDIVSVGDRVKFKSDAHQSQYALSYCENRRFANFVNGLISREFVIESITDTYHITGVKYYMPGRQGPVSIITLTEFEKYFEVVKKATPKPSVFEFTVDKTITINDTKVTKENYKEFIESIRKVFE